ncbi:hypothetical protein ACHAQJ_001208 [Trichoderma viride]
MRAPLVTPDHLSPEQQPLYQDMKSVISTHLGSFQSETAEKALTGPWSAWLQEPQFGGAVWNLVKTITVQATLPNEVRETAILVVGAHFKSAYELYAHASQARVEGMNADKVASLAKGLRPHDLSKEESVAYTVALALVNGGVLPDDTYSQAIKTFGQHGANELIYLVGTYCLVSMTLNGFDIPVNASSS